MQDIDARWRGSSLTDGEAWPLRIFKQRWYVVGRNCGLNKVRIFALDRISELVATKRKYRYPKSFNPEVYFHDCYGITNDDETDAVEVVVKVSERQAHYMMAFPLHHSQELLSYGSDVEVIGPEWLRREFAVTFRSSKSYAYLTSRRIFSICFLLSGK